MTTQKMALLGLLFIVLAMPMAAFAQLPAAPNYYVNNYNDAVVSTCLSNNTIMNTLTVYRCVNNDCNYITANATKVCQYGCNSRDVPNQCNPSPQQATWQFGAVIFVVIILIVGAAWYLTRRR